MIVEYSGKKPQLAQGVFVAPTAVIIGDVTIGAGSSVWYGAVLRGDFGKITVGENTSIQDNAVIHTNLTEQTVIGNNVIIAHGAVLHSAKVSNGAVVGVNAVLLDGSVIGEQSMIAAGSVVAAGADIPSKYLAAGCPAILKKELAGESLNWVAGSGMSYPSLARNYLKQGLDKPTNFLDSNG